MHINFIEKKHFDFSPKSLIAMIKERRFDPTKKDLVIIVAALLGFMLLFGSVQKLRLDLLTSKKNDVERSLRAQKGGAAAPLQLGNEAQIKAFIAFDARIDWATIIDSVASEIPSEVSLRSIVSDSGKRMLEIVGSADDHTAVASTLSSLKTVKACREVDLISSTVNAGEDAEAQIIFTVQCRI